jgi:putative DNA primase/helicase
LKNEKVKVTVEEFLSAFFIENDDFHIRVFPDKKADDGFTAKNYSSNLSGVNNLVPELEAHNKKNRGIFFVINTGGNFDKEINRINAQFFESDTLSIEEQLNLINKFPIEPSIIVKTRKSLHVYFLMKEAKKEDFRRIQKKLIHHFQGDPQCINESRVFRIPNFNHCKKEPVKVECLKFNPELRYTQDEIEEHLADIVEEKITETREVEKNTRGLDLILRKCLFLNHCKENAKTLSEHDWYSMITNLAVFEGGDAVIHDYSSGYDGYFYSETQGKLEQFYKSNTGPITCETIAKKGFKCPNLNKCKANAPAGGC